LQIKKYHMAILHRKEEKLQVVLGRLPKEYSEEEFVQMFIKLYSKDWGKIKQAYIKQNQDKEPGTVTTMPKPELYLKQILDIYLANKVVETKTAEPVKAAKSSAKKKDADAKPAATKKVVAAKKKDDSAKSPIKKVNAEKK